MWLYLSFSICIIVSHLFKMCVFDSTMEKMKHDPNANYTTVSVHIHLCSVKVHNINEYDWLQWYNLHLDHVSFFPLYYQKRTF